MFNTSVCKVLVLFVTAISVVGCAKQTQPKIEPDRITVAAPAYMHPGIVAEGYVDLELVVNERGAVDNAIVLESTDPLLEPVAIEAALAFQYQPRNVDGIPVTSYSVITRVTFRLENETEEAAVLATEDAWAKAESEKDEATLRRVLDDQFVHNSNNGQTSGKEAMIESVLGSSITGQTITERTVLVTGNTAIIYGTTEIRYGSPGEDETTPPLRYTSVYVKRGEQWRAIGLHMTERTAQ